MNEVAEQNEERQNNTKKEIVGPRIVEIPEDWVAVRLGDEKHSEWITQGPNPDYGKDTSSSTYRALKTKDLYDDGILYENADEISEKTYLDSNKYKLEDKDLLIAIVGRGSIGKTHIFHETQTRKYIFTRAIGLVRTNPDVILPEYLHHYFQSHKAKEYFYQSITGSTGQEVLRMSAIRMMPIPRPTIPEQRRISKILSTVDEEILQTNTIIERSKELKSGLMQDLFTYGTERYNDFDETRAGKVPTEWSVDRVDEHAKIVSGTHVKSDLVSSDPSLTPYLTGPSDFNRTEFNITKYTDSPKAFCEPDDTLVVVKGMGCGQSAFTGSHAAISRQLKAIRPDESLNPKYVFYWIRYMEQILYILAEGTRQLGLSNSDIESFPIPVPPLEEQRLIADTLTKVDEKIGEEMNYKQKLEELKRGLMQDLLTGKVRVNPDNTDT